MKSLVSKSLEKYVEEHTGDVSPLFGVLEKETYEKMQYPEMLIGKVEGHFLQLLIKISGARDVLEIGTFTGYSALMMAEGLPEDGKLITCEISEECANFAQRYFDKSPQGYKIQLTRGPALKTLERLADESIDFVFIDADKTSYLHYYEESVRILKKGGIITADNILWSGQVLDPRDEDSRAIALFNERVRSDDRVEKVMLTVRDGVYLIRKSVDYP
jgi:caffeoyl-CoA O-methyltransferase